MLRFILVICTLTFLHCCVPAAGFSDTSVCDIYLQNSDWLPDAYVQNAYCACTILPNDIATSNCVRKYLYERLQNFNSTLKNILYQKKLEYNKNPLLNWISYNAFIVQELTPVIYKEHVDAYRR